MKTELPIKKNEEYIVEIIDQGYEGEGVAKIQNIPVFIPGAIKGEKAKIIIVKVTSSHAFGKLMEVIERSEYRKEKDCKTYPRCGGCSLRHIEYTKILEMKRDMVQNLVNKTLKTEIKVKNTIGMEKPFYYRNKAQYPVGLDKNGETTFGVYAQRTHEIIPIKECFIQTKISKEIAEVIVNFMR